MSTTSPDAGLPTVLSRKYLPAFDGIRAIAAAIVVVGHAKILPIEADLGVSVFFVISGFLITWLLVGEHEATGDVSLRGFYVRRTFRIFPAYYAFLAVTFAVDTLRNDPWHGMRIAANLGYFVNYYNAALGHPGDSTAHMWSLAVEEQFYLLWPLAFLLLARSGLRTLRNALLAAIVVVAAWRSFCYVVLGFGEAYVYNAFDTRFDNLAIGCALALLVRQPEVARHARLVAGAWWMPLPVIALIGISRSATPAWYHYTVGFSVDALLIAVLFVQLLQLVSTRPWSFLELRTMRWLGTISYPVYLYHGWGLGVGAQFGALPPLARFAIAVVATLLLACGSYYVIERPAMSLRRRFERSPRRVVEAPAEASAAA